MTAAIAAIIALTALHAYTLHHLTSRLTRQLHDLTAETRLLHRTINQHNQEGP
jgi:hypothetical protein